MSILFLAALLPLGLLTACAFTLSLMTYQLSMLALSLVCLRKSL